MQTPIRLRLSYLARLARVHRTPGLVTAEQLEHWLAAPRWAPETRKSARSSVRSFYRWAHRAGHIEADPSAGLESVTVPRAGARPTPDAVLVDALERADDRLVFMCQLAAFAGLRSSEIAAVHGRDYAAGILTVRGKGRKTRHVPVIGALAARLEQLDSWAFPSPYHGRAHLTGGHVTRVVSAGLPPGWTAHTLRHRFATRAYAGTRDLLAVSALLGHSRPETTQRYVAMPDDALAGAVAAAGQLLAG